MRLTKPCILIILLLVLLAPKFAWPQVSPTDVQQVIADIVEDLTSKSDSEKDYSQLVEDLLELSENPINLNSATADDLKKLFFLNDFQVSSLLEYRDSTGSILSLYELQAVPGFDVIDIQRLSLFVKTDQVAKTHPKSMLYGRSELSFRYKTSIETPVGYSDSYTGSKYLGDKNSYFTRYTYRGGKHLQLGFTAEKDPGEPFFDGTFKTGIDYLSGYLSLSEYGKIKKLIVGDFHAEFGQGLTFWNSLSFGKSGSVLSVRKRADGLVKHSSAYESQYLRGIGVTVRVWKADLTVFGSYRDIDANITDTLANGDLAFSSLPETGYHRTEAEIADRNALTEIVAGANITYNARRVKAGVTFAHSEIDGNYGGTPAIYELTPAREEKTAVGMNADVSMGKHQLFGEIAADLPDGDLATLVGGLFRLSNTVQVSMLGRSYSRSYNPKYTSGFAEGSGTFNENGFFAGISILPTKGWKLSGYIDLFEFPWMRYSVNAPSGGRELMVLSENSFSPDFSVTLRYRFKGSEKNMADAPTRVVPVVNQTNQSFRLQSGYNATSSIALKTSLEAAIYDADGIKSEVGYLFAQDIAVSMQNLPISVNLRYAIFDTPSWNSRIYSYESDMLYSFTVPAYYSRGTRFFVLLKYSPEAWIDIWVRFSQTYYSNMDELGSGSDLIKDNTRSEIKAMVRLKF